MNEQRQAVFNELVRACAGIEPWASDLPQRLGNHFGAGWALSETMEKARDEAKGLKARLELGQEAEELARMAEEIEEKNRARKMKG